MAQLTVRGVPEDVMAALKELAKEQGISVNRLVLGMLCDAVGRDLQGNLLPEYRDRLPEQRDRALRERWADGVGRRL